MRLMRKIENVAINNHTIELAIPVEYEELPDFSGCEEKNKVPALLFWIIQKQIEQLKQ